MMVLLMADVKSVSSLNNAARDYMDRLAEIPFLFMIKLRHCERPGMLLSSPVKGVFGTVSKTLLITTDLIGIKYRSFTSWLDTSCRTLRIKYNNTSEKKPHSDFSGFSICNNS